MLVIKTKTASEPNEGLFGEVSASIPISSTTSPVNYGWQGLSYDSATKNWDNLARQYNQNTGTFPSQDPIGFASGEINLYGSRRNNPLVNFDPDGLTSKAALRIEIASLSVAVGSLLSISRVQGDAKSIQRRTALAGLAVATAGVTEYLDQKGCFGDDFNGSKLNWRQQLELYKQYEEIKNKVDDLKREFQQILEGTPEEQRT